MIDTRRYQWMIGGIGLALLVAFSLVMYLAPARHTHPGVPPGQRLRRFVAPLATSNLDVPANTAPRCDPAHPARRGLNVCDRRALVLAFFATDGAPCIRAVSALAQISKAYPRVTFAAVAAGAGKQATQRLVRRHHWALPVAYDSSAAVAALYDVTACPMIEVAGQGGIVKRLLIGDRWQSRQALARELAHLLSHRR